MQTLIKMFYMLRQIAFANFFWFCSRNKNECKSMAR